MQMSFEFGARRDLEQMMDLLKPLLANVEFHTRLDPMSQLIRSLLGSRTKDEVSWRVFQKLTHEFPTFADLMKQSPTVINMVIADVTHSEKKARYIIQALREIAAKCPDYDIGFLGSLPTHRAIAWLRHLEGVGPKIAAAVLNFSSLRMSAFVVDTHVLRVLRRFGVVSPLANSERAYQVVMAATEGWSPEKLEELHIVLKRLGQTYCQHNSVRCHECPLGWRCKRPEGG